MLSSLLLTDAACPSAAEFAEQRKRIESVPAGEETAAIDAAQAWSTTIDEIVSHRHDRIVVIGPTDVGKSSFIRALIERAPRTLIDLDPGQKMVGPPGTVSAGVVAEPGETERCTRLVFVGSTSALVISRIVAGAARLVTAAPFVANTSGFVAGLGARLQAASIAALSADCVVAIGFESAGPPLPKGWSGRLHLLPRSPLARRKSPALRRRIRQEAFARHLGDTILRLPTGPLLLEPAGPASFDGPDRPICSIADAAGTDMALAVLISVDEDAVPVRTAPLPADPARLRLGSLWATPSEETWRLRARLSPAWRRPEAPAR